MSDDHAGESQKSSWLQDLKRLWQAEPETDLELIKLLKSACSRELISVETLKMLEGVLAVTKMQVKDIMVPRPQMVSLDYDASPEKLLEIITEASHSRFPVLGANQDDVLGILLTKDFLKAYTSNAAKDFDLQAILRPAYFVPESKHLGALLQEFKAKHTHLAIVVDEYGGISGLATIEDILEEIVGDIEDEFDTETETQIQQVNTNHYHIHALTPLADINEALGTSFIDEEVDTIGGLLTLHLGHVPHAGEAIDIDGWNIKVLTADARRVLQVELIKMPSL